MASDPAAAVDGAPVADGLARDDESGTLGRSNEGVINHAAEPGSI
jgi:hypothetical protein